ncbi:MAG: glycosyltransferase family 2 protein [Hyphomonas sp.]
MPDPIAKATSAARPAVTPAPASVSLSVVINNYNYEQFLPVTIESVLGQSVSVQLIVVDDCSTDGSRDVIRRYADRLKPVFLPVNSGQGAGLNAGFAEATGDLVMFLDADDFMLPGAAEAILRNYDPQTALYLYRMRYGDEQGALGGYYPPLSTRFASGDVSPQLRQTGRYAGTITSGMVCSRAALVRIMPMDPEAFRYGGDGHIAVALPLYGLVKASDTAICCYRLHGRQHTNPSPDALTKRARWRISHDAERYKVLRAQSAALGLPVAEDLGTNDHANIKERIISLIFDPQLHPIASDRLGNLLKQARRLALSQGTGARRYLRALWWSLLASLPASTRRKLFLYEVAPATRPRWFTALVRAIRKPRG